MNIEKYNRSGTVAMLIHDFRKSKTHKNRDIDPEKSAKNVVLQAGTYADVKKRLDQVYVHGRNGKQANQIIYTCSVCIHCPDGADPETFFPKIKSMLDDKFGLENCICAVVHYDEKRPHLHYLFTPVVYDKKKERMKLCAKEVVSREMLQHWHSEFEEEYYKRYGERIQLQEPDPEKRTKQNIRNIEDYKRAKDQIKQLEQEQEKNLKIISEQKKAIEDLKSVEVSELIQLRETQKEYSLLLRHLDKLFAAIYQFLPDVWKQKLSEFADRFLYHKETNIILSFLIDLVAT